MPATPSTASATAVLLESFGRTPELVATALDGMSGRGPDPARRSRRQHARVAGLAHRMQDGQITMAERALGRGDAAQVWTAQGFAERFNLDVGDREVGYGMTSDQVAGIVAPADL